MNVYYSVVGLNISLCLCLSNKPKTLNSVLQWGHDDWKCIPTVYAIVKQLPISMILYKTWIIAQNTKIKLDKTHFALLNLI